ncbi:MAG: hypothetical protein QOK48_1840 [Blastocatellia bacterium]|nr:hypothetical protein [Blastocatellia bacterium]
MTKVSRFLGICLLIGSMATAAWADGGETLGGGLTPTDPPSTQIIMDGTSSVTSVQDSSANSTEVVNVFITWLVDSVL